MSLRFAGPAVLLALLVTAPPAAAQKAPPTAPRSAASADVCTPGEAEAELDAGGVRAKLYNIGGLFWRGREPRYEVPKGSGKNAIYAGGLWLGGMAGGELRFAGTTYNNWEYWPGPLTAGGAASASLCNRFDRIWTVSAEDLVAFRLSGATTADLAEWPVGAGAPFYVDADGDGYQGAAEPTVTLRPGDAGYDVDRAIDLAAGERPVVFGAQTAWWVMNDLGGDHAWSLTEPLGVEVRVTAWALADADRPDLYYTTAYRYDVMNRSPRRIDGLRAGLFTDADLGQFNDDYVHTDPDRSMVVFYNGDEVDDGGGGYGVPPALGIDLLTGADVGMVFTGGGTVTSDPANGAEAFAHLQGLWKDGTPLTARGYGYQTDGAVTTWAYSGDPVARAFWSEENVDGEGTRSTPADRRAVIATDLGGLLPGDEASFEAAYLFAQGASRLESVEALRAASDAAQAGYADGSFYAPHLPTPPPGQGTPPSSAPTLRAPADEAAFGPRPVTFDWTPVPGADGYLVQFSETSEFNAADAFRADAPPFELQPEQFVPNRTTARFWRVVATNEGSVGPPSEVRRVTLYRYVPGPLTWGGGAPAFVEVVGPGGVDPCGPEASSTVGCSEVFGNNVYRSFNSTTDYAGFGDGPATEETIGAFAPNEFEVRFTAEGSLAYYPDADGALIRVPFEVWDIGMVTPGQENNTADDVRLIPTLAVAPMEGGAEPVVCTFGYVGATEVGIGPTTQRIGAVPGDYAAFAAEAGPLVEADPDGCPTGPATDAAWAFADPDRGSPIRGFALEQTSTTPVAGLEGTVIRFYTNDPQSVDADDGPEATGPALAVFPNPATSRATVAFGLDAPGSVRVRVVDVLGREVLTLAAGDRPAGPHRVELDASRLAAGVYVVVLEADGVRTARTVTVAR